ncbi:hypothetical protein HDU86_005408 [Geranomyces michiganensis]|nr:hypothetical protein HDU86_005408 [Geranomyces michiganensis]
MSTTATPSQTAEIRRLLSDLSLSPSSVLELPQPTCASHSPSAVRAVRAAFNRKSLLVHPDRSTDPHAAAAFAILRAAYDAARCENGDADENGNADGAPDAHCDSTAGTDNRRNAAATAATAAEPEKRNTTTKPIPTPSVKPATAAATATSSQHAEIHRLVLHPTFAPPAVLEVPLQTCASQSPRAVRAVRAAFHSKSRLIHPDRCADPQAGAAFDILRNAYNAVCAGDVMSINNNFTATGGNYRGPSTAAAATAATASKSAGESFSAFYDRCTREAEREMAASEAWEAEAEAASRRSRRRKPAAAKQPKANPVPPRAESFDEMYDRCTRAAEEYVINAEAEAANRRSARGGTSRRKKTAARPKQQPKEAAVDEVESVSPSSSASATAPPFNRAESFEEMYDRYTRAAEDYVIKEHTRLKREKREARKKAEEREAAEGNVGGTGLP